MSGPIDQPNTPPSSPLPQEGATDRQSDTAVSAGTAETGARAKEALQGTRLFAQQFPRWQPSEDHLKRIQEGFKKRNRVLSRIRVSRRDDAAQEERMTTGVLKDYPGIAFCSEQELSEEQRAAWNTEAQRYEFYAARYREATEAIEETRAAFLESFPELTQICDRLNRRAEIQSIYVKSPNEDGVFQFVSAEAILKLNDDGGAMPQIRVVLESPERKFYPEDPENLIEINEKDLPE